MIGSDSNNPDPPNVLRLETTSAEEEDPTKDLRAALELLESKLEAADGVSGLSEWLRDVEVAITAIPNQQVSRTCDDIKALIHHLLSLNAQIQNLMRLKRLLA